MYRVEMQAVFEAAARLQELVPDAVLVGGTAAAHHAGHRVSLDDDHVVADLRRRFDEILADLEATQGWITARVQRPVLILGRLDGVETGVTKIMEKGQERRLYQWTDEFYHPYKYAEFMPNLIFGEADALELGQIEPALKDAVESAIARFVTGNLSIDDDWGGYVRELEGLGRDRYLELSTSRRWTPSARRRSRASR